MALVCSCRTPLVVTVGKLPAFESYGRPLLKWEEWRNLIEPDMCGEPKVSFVTRTTYLRTVQSMYLLRLVSLMATTGDSPLFRIPTYTVE